MERSNRIKIFAQQAPQQQQAQQAQQTPQATTIPAPPAFNISGTWGWINQSYNPHTVQLLNTIVNTLNTALHYASSGKINFSILRDNNFTVDPSMSGSTDAKNLLGLSLMLYRTYFGKGNKPQQNPNAQQIAAWNNAITNSASFLNLSQVSPTSVLAQKMPGNLKDNLLNNFKYITLYNQPTK